MRFVRHGWTLTDRNRVDSRVCLRACNIFPSMLDHNQHSGYNWHAKHNRALRRSIDLELVHGKRHRPRMSSEDEEKRENVQNQSETGVCVCVKEERRAEVKPLSLFSLSRTRR